MRRLDLHVQVKANEPHKTSKCLKDEFDLMLLKCIWLVEADGPHGSSINLSYEMTFMLLDVRRQVEADEPRSISSLNDESYPRVLNRLMQCEESLRL